MREASATALVSQYTPPRPAPKESAGPCMVEGCAGQLEVRHDRMFGKVYTTCPACERRVLEVRQLLAQLTRLRAELLHLTDARDAARSSAGPSKRELAQRVAAERRDARVARNAEIERRYRAGESTISIGKSLGLTAQAVSYVLQARAVARRPFGRRVTP